MKRRVMLNQIPAENPKYSVTIQVKKDNLVYSSNATLPKGKVTSISVRYVFNKYIIKV